MTFGSMVYSLPAVMAQLYEYVILLMVQESGDHLGFLSNPLNNEINGQPQLVNAGFVNDQQ